ncbi:MAG: YggS family pyridoxal phosphate-dependent enzyme [Bacteriovoracaceae bacterium]|nr:YggS family pyridoxal phosphate-dependent enzyme [Bacteriovoracaceae bacterium]
MTDSTDLFKSRLASIHDYLVSKKSKASIIAVSKRQPIEKIRALYRLGQREFGENRVEEFSQKVVDLDAEDINWHFIGHLQTNKVKALLNIKGLKYIHSIDSLKLLKILFKEESHFPGDQLKFFLQVNTSGEKEKGGFTSYRELSEAVQYITDLPQGRIVLHGLMTMGKYRTDQFEADARACFSELKDMRDALKEDFSLTLKLSMGMSSDWKWAVDYDADLLRVGTAIFGARSS